MNDPIEQFRRAIAAAGLTPPDTINADGKMEYEFSAPDNAAFYRLETR